MNALSQLFILSPRGDSIVARSFRNDVGSLEAASAAFFDRAKDAPSPVVVVDGTTFVFLSVSKLFFVASTKYLVSLNYVLELLHRLAAVIRDYLGALTEEALRRNFVLVYELLDEVLDYGLAQTTSTETLKAFVFNEPVVLDAVAAHNKIDTLPSVPVPGGSRTSTPTLFGGRRFGRAARAGGAAARRGPRNEVFVDVVERLTVLLSPNSQLLNCEIDGAVRMKAYVDGNPQLKLALNESLRVGGLRGERLDDANFHECVDLSAFASQRTLTLTPVEGEFAVMNYRVSAAAAETLPPLRLVPRLVERSGTEFTLELEVDADFPNNACATNLVFTVALPTAAASASSTHRGPAVDDDGTIGMSSEFVKTPKRAVVWRVKKFFGGSHAALRIKCVCGGGNGYARREIGPISVKGEIPAFNVSPLHVRHLTVLGHAPLGPPRKWVRYMTLLESYVCRV